MESIHLSFAYSAWWLLPIFIFSIATAWWMYTGKTTWTRRVRMSLAFLRFLGLFFAMVLLLDPVLTYFRSFKEQPYFPVLLDDSQSIALATKDSEEIKEVAFRAKEQLERQGFNSQILTIRGSRSPKDSITFQAKTTPLGDLIDRGIKLGGKSTIDKLLLVSDGIYNQGASPVYKAYKPSIWTLGVGDTVPRKDVALKSLQNNTVAFLGNKFPIRANLHITGCKGQEVEMILKNGLSVLDRQKVRIDKDFMIQNVDFEVLARTKGVQRFSVEAVPLNGESNKGNNLLTTYVDIVDDRENILIVSKAPHPAIKAIRSALAKLENLHVDLWMPGLPSPSPKEYDLIVLVNCLKDELAEAQKHIKDKTSLFYIVGGQVDYGTFSRENGLVSITSSQSDQVQGVVNMSFAKFKVSESLSMELAKKPPVEVPFGEVQPKPGAEVLLYQRVNGVDTQKPLLLIGQVPKKVGVFLTDGFWLWRMYESQESSSTENFDGLIVKTVQYLSSKEDKRKFRVYAHQKEYQEGETARIETELFNDLYEQVYGQAIQFQITDASGKSKGYTFVPEEGASAFALPLLAPGIYKANAKTRFNGKEHTAYTEFVVKESNLEALDLRADHQLLRELSAKNDGRFFPFQKREALLEALGKMEAKAVWRTEEHTQPLIDQKWYFFLFVLPLCLEWALRRYLGGY